MLGCPTTTRKPGLKDYGLSRARKPELCIQASRQALMRLSGTAQRIGLGDSPLTEDMCCSIETEELEQLFNAGMNMVETRKRPTNRIEKMKMKIKPMTLQKKDYCVICEESPGAHKCSVCDQFVHVICGSYSEDSGGFGLTVTCNLCVRKNRIIIEREDAKSDQEQQAQKTVSLSTQDFQQLMLGKTLWSGCLTLIEEV